MPKKSSTEPKKARWTTAQKAAKTKKPHHRGQGGATPSDKRRERTGERSFDRPRRDERPDNRGERRSFDGPRREFNRDDNRGERRSFDGPRREFNRDERPDNRGPRREFNRDDNRGERRSFDGPRREFNRDDNRGERRSFDGPRREFKRDDNRGERRSFDGPRREFNRDERPDNRGPRREFNRDDNRGERRSFDGPRREFNRDDNRGERRSFDGPRREFKRDDNRGERRSFDGPRREFNRDERPDNRGPRREFNRDDNRGERRSFDGPRREFNRDERPDRGARRPAFGAQGHGPRREFNRDERPDRPRFSRDDRPTRDTREQDVDPEAERMQADTWVKATRAEVEGPVDVAQDNGFAALGLPAVLVERLAREGITTPFPIQAASIPDAMAGRDILGRGQTGSGKTLAFGLPTLARLAGSKAEPRKPRALIMVPTRELAMQVSDSLEPLVHVVGLRHKLVAGGLSYTGQLAALNRGVDLLIATPGRLNDLLEREALTLDAVEIAILDEADHMADMGFMPEVTAILDQMPAGGQRLLFSATLDKGIDKLVENYLTDPVTHSTDDATASVDTMAHHIFLVEPQHKKVITAEIANREGRTVIFVRTKLGADRVAMQLRESGVFAAALHGGLNQGARNRVLGAFRDGTLPVLVATDVAARGIHVDDVSVVVQVDPPADHKDYLHRSGRTARAGEEGTVVTLALPHQRRTMERLARDAGVDVTPAKVTPGDELIVAAGGSAPSGEPVDHTKVARVLEAPKRGGRHGGPRQGGNRSGYRGGRDGGYRGNRDGGSREARGGHRERSYRD
ncbi:DEAD/DEAH box helicase [Janibacter sp. G56]|uniref:DEAD/DEAH box helicase n=1 Tax=Janibacter sp. G56 TaxID=3418717 RepID=UPI003CFCEAED